MIFVFYCSRTLEYHLLFPIITPVKRKKTKALCNRALFLHRASQGILLYTSTCGQKTWLVRFHNSCFLIHVSSLRYLIRSNRFIYCFVGWTEERHHSFQIQERGWWSSSLSSALWCLHVWRSLYLRSPGREMSNQSISYMRQWHRQWG